MRGEGKRKEEESFGDWRVREKETKVKSRVLQERTKNLEDT